MKPVIFDCTFREVGYQTGWFFDADFVRNYYHFAMCNGIDYLELGFLHTDKADPNRGIFRYCTEKQKEVKDLFHPFKNVVKLSAMIDVQRPLSIMKPAKDGLVDTVRILTRSKETKKDVLEKHIKELRDNGYEIFINFTSAGYNSMDMNKEFADIAAEFEVPCIYFADTESVMTESYIKNTINICHERGIKCGIHLHDKNGTAESLCDLALKRGADATDITLLGLGGKWRDGNLSVEYLLRKLKINPGYELTTMKNELISQLIKYIDHSATG